MKIQIQDQVPYQQCLRWDIQHYYYQTRGLTAFKSKEVPYFITSNYMAARQKAELILSALALMNLPADAPIQILETGGGSGLFAVQFIRAFDDLCQQRKLDYHKRLHYLLTDYSRSTLASLPDMPHFAALLHQHRLGIYVMDALAPGQGETLEGEPFAVEPSSLVASISNYNHCTLPTAILRYHNGQYWERHVKLHYWPLGKPDEKWAKPSPEYDALQTFANELLQLKHDVPPALIHAEEHILQAFYRCIDNLLFNLANPQVQQLARQMKGAELYSLLQKMVYQHVISGFTALPNQDILSFQHLLETSDGLEKIHPLSFNQDEALSHYEQKLIEEEEVFVPIDWETYIADPIEKYAIEQIAAQLSPATILYAVGSLASIRNVMPLLRPQGVLLISDKAAYSIENMNGHKPWPMTIHGNSLAHDANFPLLVLYAQALGYAGAQTQVPTHSVQTLLLRADEHMPQSLSDTFQRHYVEANLNLILCDLLTVTKSLCKERLIKDPIIYYRNILAYNPLQADTLFGLASHYISVNDYGYALFLLNQSHDDYLGVLNFSLLRGRALQGIKKYPSAIAAFHQSLERFEHDQETWLYLAQCYEALGDLEAAWKALQKLQKAGKTSQAVATAKIELEKKIKNRLLVQWIEGDLEIFPAEQTKSEVLV